jgi:hypothetical protein
MEKGLSVERSALRSCFSMSAFYGAASLGYVVRLWKAPVVSIVNVLIDCLCACQEVFELRIQDDSKALE